MTKHSRLYTRMVSRRAWKSKAVVVHDLFSVAVGVGALLLGFYTDALLLGCFLGVSILYFSFSDLSNDISDAVKKHRRLSSLKETPHA